MHDRLHKQLVITCFLEFVALFMPRLYAEIDPSTIEFLDKEVFTDIARGEKYEADVVVKVKIKGAEAFFLIHVENQASAQPEFAERMFRYFARLHESRHLPVYPVALLSWDEPRRAEPDTYRVEFPDLPVLQFRFRTIQLNRMDWRDYLHSDNPVAAALMTRMNVAPKDRPRVKLEALKAIATRRLDPAKTEVLSYYVDAYLPLTAEQQHEFEERLEAAGMRHKEAIMELTTSWEKRGIEIGREEGRQEGRQALAQTMLRLLRRQVGPLSEQQTLDVAALSLERLESLGDALLDFHTTDDLDAWLG